MQSLKRSIMLLASFLFLKKLMNNRVLHGSFFCIWFGIRFKLNCPICAVIEASVVFRSWNVDLFESIVYDEKGFPDLSVRMNWINRFGKWSRRSQPCFSNSRMPRLSNLCTSSNGRRGLVVRDAQPQGQPVLQEIENKQTGSWNGVMEKGKPNLIQRSWSFDYKETGGWISTHAPEKWWSY